MGQLKPNLLFMDKQRKRNIEQAASLFEKIRFQSDKEWGNGRVWYIMYVLCQF